MAQADDAPGQLHVLAAFNQACDERDLSRAQSLLAQVQQYLPREPAEDGGYFSQLLVDAHFRLWELRYCIPVGES